jgi:ribose transport system substrate-binding protein
LSKLRFVVSLPNDNSYQREQAAAAKETALRLGAEMQVLHAGNDAVIQSQQVLEIIQSRTMPRPSGILFEPLTTTGLMRAAEAAVAAGIGWVVLNSDVDYLDSLRSSSTVPVFCVTRDHTEIGRIQGRQFAALLPSGGTVLYIQGPANNSAAQQRTIGMESTKPANIQVKALRSSWEETNAYQAVSSWLRQILPKLFAQILALQRKLHRGLQEAELVAGIVAFAFEGVAVDLFLLQQPLQPIGQLQLAARAQLDVDSSVSKIVGVRM